MSMLTYQYLCLSQNSYKNKGTSFTIFNKTGFWNFIKHYLLLHINEKEPFILTRFVWGVLCDEWLRIHCSIRPTRLKDGAPKMNKIKFGTKYHWFINNNYNVILFLCVLRLPNMYDTVKVWGIPNTLFTYFFDKITLNQNKLSKSISSIFTKYIFL